MPEAPQKHEVWIFGSFTANLTTATLLKDDRPVKIESKPFRMLKLLLATPGALVSYSQFKAELWPDVSVEVNENVNTQINKLRKALGESSAAAYYILTQRGQGYYFKPDELVRKLKVPASAQINAESEASDDLVAQPGDMAVKTEPPVKPSANTGVTDRRKWFRYAAVGTIGLGGLLLGALKLRSKAKLPPADYRIKGNTLTVVAEDGSILWQRSFRLPIKANLSETMPRPQRPCIFNDLDGDGRMETLFYFAPASDEVRPSLVCLDDTGNQLWEFVPNRSVYSTGWEYTPPYAVEAFAVVRLIGSAVAQIVVASNHHLSYPSEVAVLDGKTGRLISDYWHRGHLRHIALFDLDFGGERQPAVVLGGVNDANEYKQATLVVFKPRNMVGGSQDPQGKPYFQGLDLGTEKAEVFFPKTPLSRGKEFNLVIDINTMGDRLAAVVVEDIGEFGSNDYIIYEFDHGLHLTNVILSNGAMLHYNALPDADKESTDALAKRLQSEVRVVRR